MTIDVPVVTGGVPTASGGSGGQLSFSSGTGGRTGGTSGTGGASGTGGTSGDAAGASPDGSAEAAPLVVGTSCTPISLVSGVLNPCGHAWALAFSPEGQLLATSGSWNGTVLHLWSMVDGSHLRDIAAHAGNAYDMAFSPDGTLLASAGDADSGTSANGLVKLWNAGSGALVRSLPLTVPSAANFAYASAVAFSHDGTLLATSGIGPIEIWRVADGTRVQSIASTGTVYQVRFSPDDKRLIAAGSDGGKARVWDVASGALVLDNIATASDQASADFSPDGKLIASNGQDGQIGLVNIWDASTGALLQTMTGHIALMGRVVWVDDNRLLSDDWNGLVILWARDSSGSFAATAQWSAGSPLATMADSIGMAVSPDRQRLAVGGLLGDQGGFVFFPL